jgi:hypothetical protein
MGTRKIYNSGEAAKVPGHISYFLDDSIKEEFRPQIGNLIM